MDAQLSFRAVLIFILIGLFPTFLACKTKSSSGELKVINGSTSIPPSPYSEFYGAIRQIKTPSNKVCTGTFLSPNKVLTASHCLVFFGTNKLSPIEIEGFRSSHALISKKVDLTKPGLEVAPFDVAIATLQDPNAGDRLGIKRYPMIRSEMPATGEIIFFAGFGATNYEGTKGVGGTKRWGMNRVNGFVGTKAIFGFDTVFDSSGQSIDSALGSGDSGAAIFNSKGQIIGIFSAIQRGSSNPIISVFVPIWSEASRETLNAK